MASLPTDARRVEPEWLDALPARDPRAVRSRRDLARVNVLMGNAGIVAGALAGKLRYGARVAEIGAGSGELLCAVARSRALRGLGLELVLVDRQPCVGASTWDALTALGMRTHVVGADAVAWLAHPEASACDAIVANLFLHHFETPALARLLAYAAQRAPLFVACEPRRSALALAGASALGLVGCNDVTRHDAVVSVRAGFRDGELAALWPAGPEWKVEEGVRGPFTHRFVARRA
jgi:hypothetical protein